MNGASPDNPIAPSSSSSLGATSALNCSAVVHSWILAAVAVLISQLSMACSLFQTTAVAKGHIPTRHVILCAGRVLIPPKFVGLWAMLINPFLSVMKMIDSRSSVSAMSLSLWLLTAVMAWENSSIILFPSLLLASKAKCCFQLVERGMVTLLVPIVKELTDEKGVASIDEGEKE